MKLLFLQFPLKLSFKQHCHKIFKRAGNCMFDFTKPFSQLNNEEKNIFLFGFQNYKFLKSKGKKTTLGDYIKWQGLYSLIYDNLDKIEIETEIRNSKHNIICPFCVKGFNPKRGKFLYCKSKKYSLILIMVKK